MRQKNFRLKFWFFRPPLFIHKPIRYQKLSETRHRRVFLQSSSVLRGKKKLDEKSWHNPLKQKIFRFPNQWHPRKFAYEFFRHCETKNFRKKILILPPPPGLIHKLFRYRKLSEVWHRKGSPTKFFGTGRHKIFDRKSWFSLPPPPPPLLSINFFDNRYFVKHRIFRYQKFSELQKGCSTKFFDTLTQKFFNGKSWYPFA